MRAFVILACVSLAYSRPEPPVGYSYSAPSPKYSAPSGSYGTPSIGHSGGSISLGHSSSSISLGHSGGISLGGHSSGGYSLGGGHSSGGLSLGGHSLGGISLGGGHSSGGIGGDSGFGSGYAGGYSEAPLVQKHIYVHVPPPEPVEHKIPRIPVVAPPQKHYKIIFIKAPAPPAPVAPIIPVQPQNEEKTLVYVLVKKPEDQPDIVIPTPAPTQPSKPEVYFIKYQTQKESGAGGIGGADLGGAGLGGVGLGGAGLGGAGLGGAGLGGGSGVGGDLSGAGGHGGPDISSDFRVSGGDEAGADAGHGSATSTQYGPPGHVAGPLH